MNLSLPLTAGNDLQVDQTVYPFISIVVPFRDAARWLRPCLDGLLNQSLESNGYEIIAVDNNSRDDSVAIVNEFPQIKLLHETQGSAYSARNLGIQHSRGSIIAFTDADCIPSPVWLQKIVNALADPDTYIVLGKRNSNPESGLLSLWSAYENAKEEFVFSCGTPELYYGHTNNMAVKREIFEILGPFATLTRGADTVLVRSAVDELGCDSVVYYADIQVSHLEMSSASSLLRKLYIYGRSSVTYKRMIDASTLDFPQRWSVFRQAVENEKYTLFPAVKLLSLLVVGFFSWCLGSNSARTAAAIRGRREMSQKTAEV